MSEFGYAPRTVLFWVIPSHNPAFQCTPREMLLDFYGIRAGNKHLEGKVKRLSGLGERNVWRASLSVTNMCLKLKRNENVLDCQRLLMENLRDKMKESGIAEGL